MTWNVAHNFPVSKDTYEVPVDYPTVGYDTIIALWFTDVFTSILATQDVLVGAGRKFVLKAGDTMTGDLEVPFISATAQKAIEITFPDGEFHFNEVFKFITEAVTILHMGDPITSEVDIDLTAGKTVDGINLKLPVWAVDIEVSDKTKGFILKSPNNSRFRIEVSDGGVLSTEAL